MDRRTLALMWVGGAALAVLLTVAGPGAVTAMLDRTLPRLIDAAALLLVPTSLAAREAVRGCAIAGFVLFIVLCVLARRRGLSSMGAAVAVTVLLLLLVGAPRDWDHAVQGGRWLVALILTVAAAALMTRRLAGNTRGPGWRGRDRR